MTQENSDLQDTAISLLCKRLMLVLFSCFFLSIPCGTNQVPQSVPAETRVVGPFPIRPVQAVPDLFPVPGRLRTQVDFWKKIFTEYTADQLVIHDNRYLSVIYEVIDTKNMGYLIRKYGKHPMKAARAKYKQLLADLPWDNPQQMTEQERQIYLLFEDIPESPHFTRKDAKDRIRVQAGHADSFQVGLIRSGRYLETIKQTFAKYGLPQELAHLPLIESGFDPLIISSVGAAGIWQFMQRTGSAYDLRIDDMVDERKDPLLSTHAAAKLLKQNHYDLKSWPLAITAYNHGAKGLKKAIKQTGSRNISDIVEKYDGRRFEFASRNFYAEFLAALEVVSHHKEYFGEIEFDAPLRFVQFELQDHISPKTLEEHSSLTLDVIRESNPALDPCVFEPGRFIPKGYRLNMPLMYKKAFSETYASIPNTLKYKYVSSNAKYRVKRGQTLSEIARAHNTSVEMFLKLNRIQDPEMIKVGQWLKIPGKYISLDGKKYLQFEEEQSVTGLLVKTNHRVRRGQTLLTIAKIYNTSAQAIARLNAIRNPQHIMAGQMLKIPEG